MLTILIFIKISVQTNCPAEGGVSKENSVCYKTVGTVYSTGTGQIMRCSAECLGGCLTKDDNNRQLKLSKTQNECYSCKNFLSPMSSEKFSTHGNHGCWPKCSEGFVSVRSLIGLRKCKILKTIGGIY